MFASTLHSPKPHVRGTFVLASGLSIKWARFVSWVVTTPVLLGQISGISQVKWGNFNMNSAMTAAMRPNVCFRRASFLLGIFGKKHDFRKNNREIHLERCSGLI